MSRGQTRFFIALSLILVLSMDLGAEDSKSPDEKPPQSGTSLERPVIQADLKIQPYEYRPVDAALWARIQELMKLGNYIEMLRLGSQQIGITEAGTSTHFEGKLLAAMGLYHLNLKVAASYLFYQLAQEQIGTSAGEAALYYLGEISQTPEADHGAIEDVLIANEFGPLHPYIQSFVSYYKGMYNLRYNLKWSDDEFKKIDPGTFWSYQKLYLSALSEIARGRLDIGQKILEQLRDNPDVSPMIRHRATVQIARLNFENASFVSALKLYQSTEGIGVREKGRLMLEQAWAQYYQKEYAKALGILKALEAPYFSSSMTFERYILTMIIYKELCYYEAVTQTAKEFRRIFSTALRDIKKRKRLSDNPTLAKMALLHGRLRERADLIYTIRDESQLFEQLGFSELSYYPNIKSYYRSRDAELQAILSFEMEKRVREIAVDLLDVEEQVQFLEYTAQLDSLRILREGEKYRYYKADRINYFGFDRIYWPVTTEFWWDEIDHYKVLASSRCGGESSEMTETSK
jgi:hypothetical protein